MEIGRYDVFLSVGKEHHANIEILRSIPSKDENVLTLFLQDTTFYTGMDAGFVAICECVPGEERWYLATVYHEWYLRMHRETEDT